MEGSPVEIAANIAVLISAAGGLIVSIYVRYNTLQNGRMEFLTILESVSATDGERSDVADAVHSYKNGDVHADRLRRLASELHQVEAQIMSKCESIRRMENGNEHRRNPMAREVDRALSQVKMNRQLEQTLSGRAHYMWLMFMGVLRGSMKLVWSVILFVLLFGATPMLARWQMARDDILELVRQRENVRSRILFHQAFVAHSRAINQEAVTNLLVEEIKRLQSKQSGLHDSQEVAFNHLIKEITVLQSQLGQTCGVALHTHEPLQGLSHDDSEIKSVIVTSTQLPKGSNEGEEDYGPDTAEGISQFANSTRPQRARASRL